MPKFEQPKQIVDVLSAPMGELIASLGKGVAEAQQEMDQQTIANFKEVYNAAEGTLAELKSIGYQPTWYHIPEVNAEIKMALTISGEGSNVQSPRTRLLQARPRLGMYATPVDASYSNKFNYDTTGSTVVKFRIVPVPPSSQASEMKIVPNVIGKTITEVKQLLQPLGIEFVAQPASGALKDTMKVTQQDPAAGEILPGGEILNLSVK